MTFGEKLLPVIEPVVDKLVGFIAYLVQCMDIAPELTGKIGLIVTAALLLAPLRALGDGIAWVGDKLGLTSGPAVPATGYGSGAGSAPRIAPSSVSALEGPRTLAAPQGFATTQIAGAMNRSQNRSTSISGGINVYAQNVPTLEEIEENFLLC